MNICNMILQTFLRISNRFYLLHIIWRRVGVKHLSSIQWLSYYHQIIYPNQPLWDALCEVSIILFRDWYWVKVKEFLGRFIFSVLTLTKGLGNIADRATQNIRHGGHSWSEDMVRFSSNDRHFIITSSHGIINLSRYLFCHSCPLCVCQHFWDLETTKPSSEGDGHIWAETSNNLFDEFLVCIL